MCTSEALQELEYRVTYYAHNAMLSGHANQETANIKKGRYSIIWCEFPIICWHVPRPSPAKVLAAICVWAALATRAQRCSGATRTRAIVHKPGGGRHVSYCRKGETNAAEESRSQAQETKVRHPRARRRLWKLRCRIGRSR